MANTPQTACQSVAHDMLWLRAVRLTRWVQGRLMDTQNALEWTDKARSTLDDVRVRAEGWDERVRTFASEKPLMAVLCAALGGYTLARLTTWR